MNVITDYFVSKCDHGIYMITFNMAERWEHIERLDDTTYRLRDNITNVPKFLDSETYLVTEVLEKDQMSFIYIPMSLFKNKKTIYQCKLDSV